MDAAEKLNHKKTYADDFFEHFPNEKKVDGVPCYCRDVIYDVGCFCNPTCSMCWNEPMPEEETT